MRISFLALVLVAPLVAPLVARADATAGPGMCVEQSSGCGGCGSQEYCNPPAPDLSVPRDLSLPRDLAPPSDGALALRRRYKTMRPTPADSALAASDTRSES